MKTLIFGILILGSFSTFAQSFSQRKANMQKIIDEVVSDYKKERCFFQLNPHSPNLYKEAAECLKVSTQYLYQLESDENESFSEILTRLQTTETKKYECAGDDLLNYKIMINQEEDFGQIYQIHFDGTIGSGAITTKGIRVEPSANLSGVFLEGMIASGDSESILFSLLLIDDQKNVEGFYFNPLTNPATRIGLRCHLQD